VWIVKRDGFSQNGIEPAWRDVRQDQRDIGVDGMSEYDELKAAADAAIAECEDAGQRWPTGDDWFSPGHYSAELGYVKAASPVVVKELLAEIDRLRTAEGDAMTYKAGMENVAQQRDQLKVELEQLAKKIKHSDYWYGTRYETLFHWAHRELNESQKNQYFSIVANGSAHPDHPPTYAQQMNRLKWKVEAAEKERDMLKAELEALRKDAERLTFLDESAMALKKSLER
jgi:Tfp pilus assembly protein PilN